MDGGVGTETESGRALAAVEERSREADAALVAENGRAIVPQSGREVATREEGAGPEAYALSAADTASTFASMVRWNGRGEFSADDLRVEWGANAGRELAFVNEFLQANPDIDDLFADAGYTGWPLGMKALAILSRKFAPDAGDPTSWRTGQPGAAPQSLSQSRNQTMTNTGPTDEASLRRKLALLTERQDVAMRSGDVGLAKALDREIESVAGAIPFNGPIGDYVT